MGAFKAIAIDIANGIPDADAYERARKDRARRAYKAKQITAREFTREIHEAEHEACNMRGNAIRNWLNLSRTK